MGENPWYPMENSTPRLLGNADNLSENCDARVNTSLSMVPLTFLVGRELQSHFLKSYSGQGATGWSLAQLPDLVERRRLARNAPFGHLVPEP
jgi:hypothetical protein